MKTTMTSTVSDESIPCADASVTEVSCCSELASEAKRGSPREIRNTSSACSTESSASTTSNTSELNIDGELRQQSPSPYSGVQNLPAPRVLCAPGSKTQFLESEVLRLTMQTLDEMGFPEAADAIRTRTGYTVSPPSVEKLSAYITNGEWNLAHNCVDRIVGNMHECNQVDVGLIRFSLKVQEWIELVVNNLQPHSSPVNGKIMNEESEQLTVTDPDSCNNIGNVLRFLQHDLMNSRSEVEQCVSSSDMHRLASLMIYSHAADVCSAGEQILCDTIQRYFSTDRPNHISQVNAAVWKQSQSIEECRKHLVKLVSELLPPGAVVPRSRLLQLLERAVSGSEGYSIPGINNTPVSLLRDLAPRADTSNAQYSGTTVQILTPASRDENDEVWVVSFSPCGKLLSSSGNGIDIDIWTATIDQASGSQCPRFEQVSGPIKVHKSHPTSMAWNQNELQLLSCSARIVCVSSIDSETFKATNIERQVTNAKFTCAAWLDDGVHFVTGGLDKVLRLWKFDTGKLTIISSFRGCEVYDIVISYKQQIMVLACGQRQILCFKTNQLWPPYPTPTLNSTTPFVGNWSALRRAPRQRLDAESEYVSCNDDDDSSDESDTASNAEVTSGGENEDSSQQSETESIDLSPASQVVKRTGSISEFGNEDSTYKVLGQPLRHIKTRTSVTSLCMSGDGRSFLVSRIGGHLELWDCVTLKRVKRFGGYRNCNVTLKPAISRSSSNLVLATGSEDCKVHVWHSRSVENCVLDCKSCSAKSTCTFEGHRALVNSVAFHPEDSRVLVSASDDGDIRVWWSG